MPNRIGVAAVLLSVPLACFGASAAADGASGPALETGLPLDPPIKTLADQSAPANGAASGTTAAPTSE